jgi:Concanavalin A-like lectin/glucanases superfamily
MSALRTALVLAATGAALAAGLAPAHADASTAVAIWELNEPAGSTVMTDTGPNHLNGVVGSEVVTGLNSDGATGYDFAWLKPNTPPAHPAHGVTVAENDLLDPGTRDYAVTLRMRTTSNFGNVIQKGQGGVAGGRWKIEAPKGQIVCTFQGSSGYVDIKSTVAINDGKWHVVRCARTAKTVTVTIDGVLNGTKKGATGTINNTLPLAIAGKVSCDQVKVTCDYFPGEIDRVQIDAS